MRTRWPSFAAQIGSRWRGNRRRDRPVPRRRRLASAAIARHSAHRTSPAVSRTSSALGGHDQRAGLRRRRARCRVRGPDGVVPLDAAAEASPRRAAPGREHAPSRRPSEHRCSAATAPARHSASTAPRSTGAAELAFERRRARRDVGWIRRRQHVDADAEHHVQHAARPPIPPRPGCRPACAAGGRPRRRRSATSRACRRPVAAAMPSDTAEPGGHRQQRHRARRRPEHDAARRCRRRPATPTRARAGRGPPTARRRAPRSLLRRRASAQREREVVGRADVVEPEHARARAARGAAAPARGRRRSRQEHRPPARRTGH